MTDDDAPTIRTHVHDALQQRAGAMDRERLLDRVTRQTDRDVRAVRETLAAMEREGAVYEVNEVVKRV